MLVIVARLLHLRDVRSDGVLQEVPEILYAESHEKLLGALQHAVVFCFFDERLTKVEIHKSPPTHRYFVRWRGHGVGGEVTAMPGR